MPRAGWDTGVYQIKNLINGKVYVGSAAKSLEGRINAYKWMLPRGKCHNKHLQAAWNKYGRAAFCHKILERCFPSRCIEREQYWIDKLQAANPKFGYNICPTAGSALGRKMSEEFCKAVSRRLKGVPASEESRRKQSETRKGRPISKEVAERLHASWRGKKHTEAARLKISAANRERTHTEMTKKKLSIAAKLQWAKKMSRKMPESQCAAIKAARSTEVSRKKTSEANKVVWKKRKQNVVSE